ncbi:MAG: PD-(D/E)XK nuclease family protein [Candidatus Nezhaarchaeales archaeon]
MITSDLIYDAFRRFLVKQLRVYDKDTIHVGEATNCLRKSWFNRKLGNRDFEHLAPSKRVILGLGLSTHFVLEGVLRELGYIVEQSIVKSYGLFKLAGTPDAVNEVDVIEIKTVNKLPDEPLPHHVMQLNGYLALFERSSGYVIYICKRDGNVRVFKVDYNEELFKKLLERAARLHEALKRNVEPEPEPSFLCNYCEWKWSCYSKEAKR